MKKLNIFLLGFAIAILSGCTYSFPDPPESTSGTADFSKVVAVGNSLSAGLMDGALYNAGQQASFVNIVAEQMKNVGGGDFNQPDINAQDGVILEFSPAVLGRLVLKGELTPEGLVNPLPQPIGPGQPLTAYGGDKSALNNFAVPGIKLIEVDIAGYGNSTNGNPYFNRFASAETASVLGDAINAQGSFFIFWLGGNDVLGYATGGAADPSDLTEAAVFDAKYKSVIADLITTPGKKGVLINVPNVQDIAFFTTVPYNAIPMDQATADATNASFQPVNNVFDALKDPAFGLDADDLDARKVSYSAGNNPVTMQDDKLVDLGPYFDTLEGMGAISPTERAMLEPYRQSRPMNSSDLLTMTASLVLGSLADPNNPASVIGVGVPLAENYTLTYADQELIADRTAAFNATIESVANGSGDLGLFDFNTEFSDFVQNGVLINGSGLDGTIFPPAGAFSLDGVHPNQRGSAYIASLLIDAINSQFGSTIPNINPNDWAGNPLPIPIQ